MNPYEQSDDEIVNINNLLTNNDDNNSDDQIYNNQLINSCRCENNQKLINKESSAVDYFETREFKGLIATVAADQDTSIHPGQYGTAHKYRNDYI